MRSFITCCAILLASAGAFAQSRPDLPGNSPEVEALFENANDENASYSATLDELEFYHAHPVHINTASFQELSQVPFLSPQLALTILFKRDSLGVLTPADLEHLPELGHNTLTLISPFIAFDVPEIREEGSANANPGWTISGRSRFTSRPQAAFQSAAEKYPGSEVRQYDRLDFNSTKISGGVVYDRDPGETFDAGFESGYVGIENEGIIQKALLGDYTLNSGEGLTLSNFRSSSMGGNALYQVKSKGRTIVPHLSTDEFHYFRGAAVTVELHPLSLTTFYSAKPMDATVDSSNVVTSFYTSGLFRSPEELKKRNAAHETTFGGIGILSIGNTDHIGMTAVETRYDRDVAVQSPTVFSGRGFFALGINGDFNFHAWTMFGEIGGNSVNSQAGVIGAICTVTKRLSLSAQVRSYSQKYTDNFAYAFGEQNGTANGETGRYLGMEFRLSEAVKISAYRDEFSLPSQCSFAKEGDENVIRVECALTEKSSASFQFKQKTKWDTYAVAGENQNINAIFQERSERDIRGSLSFVAARWLEFTQRVEVDQVNYTFSKNRESGMLAYIEAASSSPRLPWHVTARMVFFDTPSYDSRVYEYENDVRGGYSSPALYGTGLRWYFVAGWRIFAKTELSLKYSETLKPGGESSGVPGPLDTAATIQLDVVL